jgi:hypothetical protein
MRPIPQVGAAPHCPAGHFSRIATGRKTPAQAISITINVAESSAEVAASPSSPGLRGKGAGRRMRGGAALEIE